MPPPVCRSRSPACCSPCWPPTASRWRWAWRWAAAALWATAGAEDPGRPGAGPLAIVLLAGAAVIVALGLLAPAGGGLHFAAVARRPAGYRARDPGRAGGGHRAGRAARAGAAAWLAGSRASRPASACRGAAVGRPAARRAVRAAAHRAGPRRAGRPAGRRRAAAAGRARRPCCWAAGAPAARRTWMPRRRPARCARPAWRPSRWAWCRSG